MPLGSKKTMLYNARFRTLIFQHACYKVKYGLAFWPYFASNRRLVEKFCLICKCRVKP